MRTKISAARRTIHGFERFSLLLVLLLAAMPGQAQGDLGSARLLVAGTRLAVSPESQTVPFDTPTIVETELVGYDPAEGRLPGDLRVLADFTGPEIAGILHLETIPGEPFRIPRLRLKGQYQLDSIRLVQGGELLAYAEPRSAGVLVTQVLVTRVTSRALTLEEIQSRGIALDEDSFRAFNFTFGFAVDGEVFDYNVPVIFRNVGPGDPRRVVADSPRLGRSRGTTVERFRPPQLAPFVLELERSGGGGEVPTGGCESLEGCRVQDRVRLPGVILFPTDVSLLNQFFSVVLFAQNGAPEGDPLVVRDLTAKVILPPGLRQARTEPPTPLGVPVPVRVPGPDGELGTADDVSFLVAQSTGVAEVLTEGLKEGTHVVEFQLEGVLEGFPGGEVRRITGRTRGAVLVRDPTLGVTINHPDVVRSDEEYSLLLTVANTSNQPVNLVSLTLPPSELSGVQLVGPSTETIPTLAAGDSEVVEFRLRSLRTGKVIASSVKNGGAIDPSFEFRVGVGDGGIPLSPTSIVLPRSTSLLPADLYRHALGLVGLGFSLATAPPSLLSSDLPRLGREGIDEKVYWLSQAGRHISLGEEPFDSLAALAAEWTGARKVDWEWDALRRQTQRGALLGDSFAQVVAAEASATSAVAAFERFGTSASFLGEMQMALAAGTGARLEVQSRATARRLAGSGIDPTRVRELPFTDLYDLGDAQMVLLAAPEAAGYELRLTRPGGGTVGLHVLLPGAAGGLRVLRWTGLALGSTGVALLELDPEVPSPSLSVDGNGDGVFESMLAPAESTLGPRPFTALAAVQNAEADPSGHIVDVLFSRDIDVFELNPADPSRFEVPGKVSNGGLVKAEEDVATWASGTLVENPFEGLRDSRIVRVVFNNPLSPYLYHDLTVSDVASVRGEVLSGVTLPVTTTVTQPGTIVEGTVYGPDGLPAPFARVDLYEADLCFLCSFDGACKQHRTAALQADSSGRFRFDYVRQTACGDLFRIEARDPVSGKHGTSRGRVRFIGQTVQLDVVMLGRGTVQGRITYEDGSVPESLRLVATSPVFFQGREARILPDGRYEVGDVPVGTVTLAATDREGSFVFQTVEIPTAGAVVQRDLIILRRAPDDSTGDVRGTVVETDGTTPVFDAYVALYVDDSLIGVERSDLDGTFDFGTVPAGLAEIEAYDGETGRRGAQVFFDIQPDQVNAVTLPLRDDRGTVEGHVTFRRADGSVEAVEGAVVWVSGTPFNTTTDAAGFYRLEDVFAGQRRVLAADLERGTQASAPVTVAGDGSTVFRDLVFREDLEGSGIAGEVVDYAGNPVANAFVHIDAGGDRWYREAFTDLDGRFTLPDLGPGSYRLFAFRGADGAIKRATIRFEGETPFVRIQFKKGTLRGTVRATNEDGQDVGVRSLITYRTTVVQEGIIGLDWVPRTLETEDDGSFEIPNVLAGSYVLTASNSFHGEKTVRGELVFHGELIEHDFLFRRNGSIRGTVLDFDGVTPVEGARVHLRHPSFSEFDLTTGEDGRFSFELIPPHSRRFSIDVVVDQGAVFRRARVWVRFNRFGQELDVDVVLPRQGTVAGWVEDANGFPVPGATVTLREHGYPARRLVGNADDEGYFTFTNVFDGRISLEAKAPSLGGLGGRACVEVVEEGEEVFTLISLEPTGEIAGRVLDPSDGLPVPTSAVTLYRYGDGMFDRVNADENGDFRFQLLPLGTYRVWVFDPGTGRHGRQDGLELVTNNQLLETVVELEVRGEVEGYLYERGSGPSSPGIPVPGATIKLTTDSLVKLTTYSSSDVDGYFEFLGIPEGEFRLSTREPGGRRRASGKSVIEEEGARVRLDLYLEASGRVVGSVLNPPGAPAGPFPNVNVLVDQDGQTIGATLDNPFAFEGIIAERRFKLNAREVGGDHRARASGTLSEEGEEVTLDLQMAPRGDATVTVRDSFGNPVAGASVRVVNTGFYGKKIVTASAGPDGVAVFTNLGEGSVSAYATDPVSSLRGSGSAALSLEGEMALIDIDLQDSGTVLGRVLLSDAATPAEDALVVLTRGSRTLQARADSNGDFSFETVPLGSLTVYAQEDFGPGLARAGGTLGANGEVLDLGTLVFDDEDPFVVTLDPAPGSRDLPLSTVVTVTFNEALDVSRYTSGWFRLRKLSGASVGYSVSWADGDRTAILTPSSPLASFKGYELTVRDAYDLSGRRLFEKARTVFYTVDVVPPTVIDVLPRDGEKQIPVDADLRVTFSEPVVFESLSGAAFQLTDLTSGAGVGTTFLLKPGEREVVLTPALGLQTDRQYRLTVQGVQDGSGNSMTVPVSTTFWTLDTVPPEISAVTFPAGTAFTSGDDLPVTVEATDLHGVAEVRVLVDEWTFTDQEAPYELIALAPVVALQQAVTVRVEATDVHGNTSSSSPTVQVSPLVNASPPVLELGCAREGDLVVPGVTEEVLLSAADDLAVESHSLLVDGVLVAKVTPVNLAEAGHTYLWAPPADAVPGDSFLLRLEARDFAGNVTASEVTVAVSAATVLEGGRSLFDDWNGQDLVLSGDGFIAREPLSVRSLTVMRGGSLTVDDGEPLELSAAEDLRIKCGGALEAIRTGYGSGLLPRAPSWTTAPTGAAGGSHGGAGERGNPAGTATEAYDSVYRPTLPGGAGNHEDSEGGGVIHLEVGRLLLDGEVRATSTHVSNQEIGAGGSVVIEAQTLEGIGAIVAFGGPSRRSGVGVSGYPGSGGGGRVALYIGDIQDFDPVDQVWVYGRRAVFGEWEDGLQGYSGTGTLLVLQTGDTYGHLIVNPGIGAYGTPRTGPPTALPALGTGGITTFESAGSDAWLEGSEAFLPRWLGVWAVLLDASGGELGTFEVGEIDGDGRLRLLGAGPVAGAASYRGEYRFDSVHLLDGARLESSDPVRAGQLTLEGNVKSPALLTVGDLLVRAGSTLTPLDGDQVHIVASGTVTLEAGAMIDVTGLSESPAEVLESGDNAGGSHGGAGAKGFQSGLAGEVFDSVYLPRRGGGDGGGGNSITSGQRGGGVVRIEAAEIVLDGEIRARGGNKFAFSGGAGGTVALEAAVLRGSGLIDASGAASRKDAVGSADFPGSGGGGRVALVAADMTGFDPTTQVLVEGQPAIEGPVGTPPERYSAPGTLYTLTGGQTYGELRVNQPVPADGAPVVWTELPTIGKGIVGTVMDLGPDAWITPQDPAQLHSLGTTGMWVRVGGVDYRVLEEAPDRRGLLLEGAAGQLAVGEAYVGFYRFDRATVGGAGRLRLFDGEEVGEWVVEPSASLELFDLDPPLIDLLEPAAGTVFASGQMVRIAADVTDSGGVVAVTFRFGADTSVDSEAPYEWITPAPEMAVEGDVVIEVEAEDPNANLATESLVVRVRPAQPGDLPGLAAQPLTVLEEDAGSRDSAFRLLLGAASEFTVSVDYALVGESATAGDDFAADTGTLTFAPGETWKLLPVTVHGDALPEGDETFRLELSSGYGLEILTPSATATLLDDDGGHCWGPELVVNGGAEEPLAAGEIPGWTEAAGTQWTYRSATPDPHQGSAYLFPGAVASAELAQDVDLSAYAGPIDAGTAAFLFTAYVSSFDLEPPDTSRVVLEYRDAGQQTLLGSSDSLEHYSPEVWRQVSETFVPPAGTRWVRIRLFSERGSGQNNNGSFDSVSLRSMDVPHLSGGASVIEGTGGDTPLDVTIDRSCGAGPALSLTWATADGSAVAGPDYLAGSGTLDFAAGEASATVGVTVVGDNVLEVDESFSIVLTDSSGSLALPTEGAVVTILDDDRPALTVHPFTVLEEDGGSRTSAFRFTLSLAPVSAASVDYQLVGETATAGVDFVAAAGTLDLVLGETEGLLPVTVLGDLLQEGDETFRLELSGASGVEVLTPVTTATLVDNDDGHCWGPELIANGGAEVPLVSGEIPDWTEVSGTSWTYRSATPAPFEGGAYFFPGAVASAELAQDVDLTAYGSAADAGLAVFLFTGYVSSFDLEPPDTARIVLEFRDGTGQTVLGTFDSLEHYSPEVWRQISAMLLPPVGTRSVRVRLLGELGSGTNNNASFDALSLRALDVPHVAAGTASVAEGDAGTTPVSLPVSRTCGLAAALSLSWATADGSAQAGSDYGSDAGTLEFAAGEAVAHLPLAVLGDEFIEGDETFSAVLSGAPAGVVFSAGAGQVTIQDDDTLASSCTTPTLLANGGAEEPLENGEIPGWTAVAGNDWQYKTGTFPPQAGGAYFYPGEVHLPELRQDVDVSAFAAWIASGDQSFVFDGWVASADQSPPDEPRVVVEYRDAANQTVLASFDTGYLDARSGWTYVEDVRAAPPGTAWIRVRLLADRNSGAANNAYFDGLRLRALAVPHLQVAAASADEAAAPVDLEAVVTLSCFEGSSITVGYAAVTATALAGTDFEAVSGDLVFASGETQKTVAVPVFHDRLLEGDESLGLALTPEAWSFGVVELPAGDLVIADDDTAAVGCFGPELLLNPSADEALAAGELPGWTEVQGSSWTQRDTQTPVHHGEYFFYAGNEALAELAQDVDLAAYGQEIGGGTLQLSFEGFVRSYDQSPVDRSRILLELRDASNELVLASFDTGYLEATSAWLPVLFEGVAPLGTRWARVRLLAERNSGSSNDGYFDGLSLRAVSRPELAVANASVAEGDSGTAALSFPVSASCASSGVVSLSFATQDGGATAGTDYVTATGSVQLPAGTTSGSISIDVLGDTVEEGDEDFFLQLSEADHASLAAGTATGTVLDDDGSAAASRAEPRFALRLGACPRDGDLVAPGASVEIPYELWGEGPVEVRLSIGGEVAEGQRLHARPAGAPGSFTWPVPADAASGETYLLEISATGDTGWHSSATLSLRVGDGRLLEGGRTLDQSFEGQDLVLGAGEFILGEPLEVESLTLLAGARLSAPAGEPLALTARTRLTVQCGAVIDHSAGGYGGGLPGSTTGPSAAGRTPMGRSPAGVRGSSPDAGGSHGGFGTPGLLRGDAVASGLAGETYDSPFEPSLAGAGGSADNASRRAGHPGGGVVLLTAETVVLDGAVLSRGGPATGDRGGLEAGLEGSRPAPGHDGLALGGPAFEDELLETVTVEDGILLLGAGGAGGSIWIRSATLSGGGAIDASGGSSWSCTGRDETGAGGGGRVALEVVLLDGFDPERQAVAAGGAVRGCDGVPQRFAGPGTVFLRSEALPRGALWVLQPTAASIPGGSSPGGIAPPVARTRLPSVGTGTVAAVEPDPLHPGDLWIEPVGDELTFDLGVWGLEVQVGDRTYRILDQSSDRRRLLLNGAAGEVEPGHPFQGLNRLDRLTVGGGALLLLPPAYQVEQLVVEEGSRVVEP